MREIEQSYIYCVRVARTRAKNFYYSFLLLSKPQRQAMCAIYAFMRYCDDLSDDPGANRSRYRALARGTRRRAGRPFQRPSRMAGVSSYGAALRDSA